MKAPQYCERVVGVMEELVKFSPLSWDCASYLVDRYSEGRESIEVVACLKRLFAVVNAPSLTQSLRSDSSSVHLATDLQQAFGHCAGTTQSC